LLLDVSGGFIDRHFSAFALGVAFALPFVFVLLLLIAVVAARGAGLRRLEAKGVGRVDQLPLGGVLPAVGAGVHDVVEREVRDLRGTREHAAQRAALERRKDGRDALPLARLALVAHLRQALAVLLA